MWLFIDADNIERMQCCLRGHENHTSSAGVLDEDKVNQLSYGTQQQIHAEVPGTHMSETASNQEIQPAHSDSLLQILEHSGVVSYNSLSSWASYEFLHGTREKGLYSGVVVDIGNDGDMDIIGQETYAKSSGPYLYESLLKNMERTILSFCDSQSWWEVRLTSLFSCHI